MSVQVCLYYLKTQRCAKGSSCQFLHVEIKGTSATSATGNDTPQPAETGPSEHTLPNDTSGHFRRRGVCFFFGTLRGCYKGDQCTFLHTGEPAFDIPADSAHGEPTESVNPPFGSCFAFWSKGKCIGGDECRYRHIRSSAPRDESPEWRSRRQPSQSNSWWDLPRPEADEQTSWRSKVPENPPPSLSPADRLKEQGNTLFKSGDHLGAVELYTRALRLNPKEPSYLMNRAAAWIELKKFRPALSDCKEGLELEGNSPHARYLIRLARCELALGNPRAALGSLDKVLSNDPDDSAASALKASAWSLHEQLWIYSRARKDKDYAAARSALMCARTHCNDPPQSWLYWAIEVELAGREWDQAEKMINAALQVEPDLPEVLLLKAHLFFARDQLPESVQQLRYLAQADPGNYDGVTLSHAIEEIERLRGDILRSANDNSHQSVLSFCTEALQLVGQKEEHGRGGLVRASILLDRARSHLELVQYDLAVKDTSECIALNPNAYDSYSFRAKVHVKLKDYDGAILDYKKAIQLCTQDAMRRLLERQLRASERSLTKDHYSILGLHKSCTEFEVKKAYRKKSLLYHPDKGGDSERFKLMSEAFAVLSDPRRRATYDASKSD